MNALSQISRAHEHGESQAELPRVAIRLDGFLVCQMKNAEIELSILGLTHHLDSVRSRFHECIFIKMM